MISFSSDPIQEILGEKGLLAKSIKDFEFRPSQVEVAGLIDRAILEKSPVLIEAGTGTGKTLGYLVPTLICGKKTVISTGTKNLQEQIFFRDIRDGPRDRRRDHEREEELSLPAPISSAFLKSLTSQARS